MKPKGCQWKHRCWFPRCIQGVTFKNQPSGVKKKFTKEAKEFELLHSSSKLWCDGVCELLCQHSGGAGGGGREDKSFHSCTITPLWCFPCGCLVNRSFCSNGGILFHRLWEKYTLAAAPPKGSLVTRQVKGGGWWKNPNEPGEVSPSICDGMMHLNWGHLNLNDLAGSECDLDWKDFWSLFDCFCVC